jgi:hypothetical protein
VAPVSLTCLQVVGELTKHFLKSKDKRKLVQFFMAVDHKLFVFGCWWTAEICCSMFVTVVALLKGFITEALYLLLCNAM